MQAAKVDLDVKSIGFAMERAMERVARQLTANPEDEALLGTLEALATTARGRAFDVDVWQVQNIFFDLMKQSYPRLRVLAAVGDARAAAWVDSFTRLGEQLSISVDSGGN